MWVFVGVSERGAPSANTNQVILYIRMVVAYLCIYTHTHTLWFPSARGEYTCPLTIGYDVPEVAATNVRPATIDRGSPAIRPGIVYLIFMRNNTTLATAA